MRRKKEYMTKSEIEAVASEVPPELKQQIKSKFQTAVQAYNEFSTDKKTFPDYLKAIDKLYKVLFPYFEEDNHDPCNNDWGKLLEVWTLTRKAIEKTVINSAKELEPAELETYIRNLSIIEKCNIRFYKENYERKKKER